MAILTNTHLNNNNFFVFNQISFFIDFNTILPVQFTENEVRAKVLLYLNMIKYILK